MLAGGGDRGDRRRRPERRARAWTSTARGAAEHPWNRGVEIGGRGELYLEWLVGSVMPLIDRSFPTSTEREATGSSARRWAV